MNLISPQPCLAAQRREIAPVEPVDDADQPEARSVRGEPAHVHDAADIAVGHLVERAPAGLHLRAQSGDVGGDGGDDGFVGRRLGLERLRVVLAARRPKMSTKAKPLVLQSGEDFGIVDEGDGAFGAGGDGLEEEDEGYGG